MRYLLSLTVVFSLASADDQIRTGSLPAGDDHPAYRAYLQYDDGTAEWLTWGGTYRGVWFNTDDFVPGAEGFLLDFVEFWMYHHSSYPWDTDQFYAEVWNGWNTGPVEYLFSVVVTAEHFAPSFAFFSPGLLAESSFWVLENTEMSSGGWPAILGDGTPPSTDHSFYSDDFFVWEPWSDGSATGDYFIRAGGEFVMALGSTTWGSLKSVF